MDFGPETRIADAMGYEHRNQTPAQRIFGKHTLGVNGCWEWTGKLDYLGYGRLGFKNKLVLAHRLSWRAHKGEIPDGLCVLHKCDNRKCINPDHLFLGTHQDNMADRDRKKRGKCPRGIDHPQSKLNPEKAFEIRWLAASGHKQRRLAAQYGVTQRAVAQVIHNLTWRMECHD